jgi:peptidoglycan/LPS O-acetylase OafA/YrhL
MSSERRIEWIDGLRGLAALMVMAQHYLHYAELPFNPARMVAFCHADLGMIAVTVFFLVSGYIIPRTALQPSPRPLRRFVLSRIFRLYPAYWVAVLLCLLLLQPSLGQVLINLTMLQRFVGIDDLLGVFWTLQVELTFYAVVAALLLTRWKDSAASAVMCMVFFSLVSLAMAYVRYQHGIKTPVASPLSLTVMFAGSLVFWHERRAITFRQLLACYGAVGMVLIVSFQLGYAKDWGLQEHPGPLMVSYAIAAVAFALAKRFWKTVPRLFLWLGAISYSLYLLHLFAQTFILTDPTNWWKVLAAVAVSLLLADVCYRFVEKPCIALGKKVQRWSLAGAVQRSEAA